MTELFSVCDYAVRLEDHPLVKAGEVHQVVEMFRGGYLGFAKPVGGEWNPKGWRKCDAEGWIPWSGGENPVPGQSVDVKLRSGRVYKMTDSDLWGSDKLDPQDFWKHHNFAGDRNLDIIAFRLSHPASEQPVEAIGAGRRELLERLEAEVSDETMRALLSCKDVGSGRAHPAHPRPASPAGRPSGGGGGAAGGVGGCNIFTLGPCARNRASYRSA